MAKRPFVHLHCHTHFSLCDGISKIPELVELTRQQGMNALAITDHGNLSGALEFYRECQDNGLHPIIGYEAHVKADKQRAPAFHLTLLAQKRSGFENLVKLASLAQVEWDDRVPRIDKGLLAQFKDGIICLSGCVSSEFSDLILNGHIDQAEQLAGWFARTFGKNFFIEIQNNGLDIEARYRKGAIEIAGRMGLPLVATCDFHYLRPEDKVAHDAFTSITTGQALQDVRQNRIGSQFHLRSPEEMYELFPDQADAVRRSQEIADSCDLRIDFGKRTFPVSDNPGIRPLIRTLCTMGLLERYGTSNRLFQAKEQLDRELDVISSLECAEYLFMVRDIVRSAHNHGIPVRIRGSACGSMTNYVLKLSQVCPLEYGLIFERFLHPEYFPVPEIAFDVCQDRREEVIDLVRGMFGEQSVARIITFGTMTARDAIRGVGEVMDIPPEQIDQLIDMVPAVLNITIDEAINQNKDLRKKYESDPQVREWVDTARKLEGTNRSVSTHAARMIITLNGSILDHAPVQQLPENDGLVTQWVARDLEGIGLLKLDFLGSRTLTVMGRTVRLVRETQNIELDLDKLPLNDEETFALLQRGDTEGIFQLSATGIRELLPRLKPDSFRDLIAINALYRPGPLGSGRVDTYVNRKHGREKPVYLHPIMEDILAETYGVLCYQEQAMLILNRIGGMELGRAFGFVKAIGKKNREIIDDRGAEFLKRAREHGLDQQTAAAILGFVSQFAGFTFNKSHGAAYALISYQEAYLKAHFHDEFMRAVVEPEPLN